MRWVRIWKQAMTRSLPFGLGVPHKKTVGFPLFCPIAGSGIRIKLNNENSNTSAHIKGITVKIGSVVYDMRYNGKQHIVIPGGSSIYCDELDVPIADGTTLSIRLFPITKANDLNYIESEAFTYKKDVLHERDLPLCSETFIEQKFNINKMMPYIESIEIFSEHNPKTIVAFGDSITAMSRWTKPLARRIYETYGGEYLLLNAGISGNCLAFQRTSLYGDFFGTRGVDRFNKDVLSEDNITSVIFSIGTNDLAFLSDKSKKGANLDALTSVAKEVIEKAKSHGIHVVGTNIMPSLSKEEYTQEKDSLRIAYNKWLSQCKDFDYLLDWDLLSRDPQNSGCMKESFHQGDYVHPSTLGGQKLADSFVLSILTGRDTNEEKGIITKRPV